MLENEVEAGQEAGGEATETEQEALTVPAVKKPKAASAAESEPPAPAKKAKKATAIDEIMAAIKKMTVLNWRS